MSEALQMRREVNLQIEGAQAGLYLQLESTPKSDLNVAGLETRAPVQRWRTTHVLVGGGRCPGQWPQVRCFQSGVGVLGAGGERQKATLRDQCRQHPQRRVADAGGGDIDCCDDEVVQDPGQAWTTLTVGAHTKKVHLADADWEGYQPLAGEGDLCPWSCTGVAFEKEWPNKPEIVIEGGNVMLAPNGEVDFGCHELELLTMSRH